MACHKSQSCCSPSQKSALIPVTRAKRSAESGVTDRLPRTISFRRGNDTPRRIAKADCDTPRGLRNSSRSISPGWVGGWCVGSRRATNGFFLRRLVVVGDFDLVGIPVLPRKAHPVLFIDPDTILTCPVTHKSFQTVTRRHSQLVKTSNTIELRQLSTCYGP